MRGNQHRYTPVSDLLHQSPEVTTCLGIEAGSRLIHEEDFGIVYQRSGDARYRELAVRFIEKDYFDPLAAGQNVLPGEHAYSHVNAFSSANSDPRIMPCNLNNPVTLWSIN